MKLDRFRNPEEQRIVINHAVWNILVKHAGAREDEREQFMFHFPECREFRFQGIFGFGGKILYQQNRLIVTMYEENRTQDLVMAINGINSRLLMLRCPQCRQYYMHKLDCSEAK